MSEDSSGGILRVVARSPSAYAAGEPNGPNGPNDTNGPDGNLNGRGWGVGWTRAGQIAGGVARTVAVGSVAYLAKKAVSAYLWPDHPRRAQVPKVRLDQTTWRCPGYDDHGVVPSASGLATSVARILDKCIEKAIKSRAGGDLASSPRSYKGVETENGVLFWYEAKGGATMPTVRSHLHLCLSYGDASARLDPEVIATALYAGFEFARIGTLRRPAEEFERGAYGSAHAIKSTKVAASMGDRWDVTMCCGHSAPKDYCERYQRAIAAASRVVVYRADQWVRSDGGKGAWPPRTSRDSLGRQVAVEAATCIREKTDAVSLCEEYRAKSTQRVGIMVFSDGRPGGAVWDQMRGGFDGNVVVGNNPLATHESAVVSAWLRGECPAGPAGADGVRDRDRVRRHFQATIASRWSNARLGTNDPLTRRYDRYGDVWVVRDAALDTTQYGHSLAVLASDRDGEALKSTKATNVTLVFVNVNVNVEAEAHTGGARSVELAVRAGLDAMIVEGVSVAIVAPDDLDETDLVRIVNRELSGPPNEPKSDESGHAFGMQDMPRGDALRELGLKPESGARNLLHEPAVGPRSHTPAVSQMMIGRHANSGGNWAYEDESLEPIPRKRGVAALDDVISSTTRGHYFSAVHIATLVNPAARGYQQQGYQQQGYPQQGYPQQQYEPHEDFGSSTRAGSRFV